MNYNTSFNSNGFDDLTHQQIKVKELSRVPFYALTSQSAADVTSGPKLLKRTA